jgi:hypothetical protein
MFRRVRERAGGVAARRITGRGVHPSIPIWGMGRACRSAAVALCQEFPTITRSGLDEDRLQMVLDRVLGEETSVERRSWCRRWYCVIRGQVRWQRAQEVTWNQPLT